MKNSKLNKSISKIFLIGMYLAVIYVCIVVAAIIQYIVEEGLENIIIEDTMKDFLFNPVKMEIWKYRSIVTVFFVVLGTVFYLSVLLMARNNRKKFMAGKEHGTSEWGDIHAVSKKYRSVNEAENRILSENVRISINDQKTGLNNHIYALGGSGTGKTRFVIFPNLLEHNASILVTDPSGEILRDIGNDLEAAGMEIRVLNTVDLSKSNAFNPFRYLIDTTDIDKLLTMIFDNTTAKNAQSNDPYWERAERMLDKAIMYYVYMEEPYSRRNLVTVIRYMSQINVVSGKPYYYSGFGVKIHALPKNHPARSNYERVMIAPEDTLRSIISTAFSRFSMFDNNPELERVLSTDEMDLDDFGTGYHGNPKRKMVLFCITPDNGDKTYNFLIGMLYSQFFQRLYYVGDTFFNNRLPVPVMCWLDELANIALPEGFTDLLSTARKRNIGMAMFFQDIAKTKKVFKDEWESLIGNSDIFVYLGGNESGSQKYLSERLGNMTIYTRSESRSFGQHENASNQDSSTGRPLIYPSEIDVMPRDKCIIKVRGEFPVIDSKYKTFQSVAYKKAMSMGKYEFHRRPQQSNGLEMSLLSGESLDHYRKMGQVDKNYMPVVIYPELLLDIEVTEDVLDIEDLRKASEECRCRMEREKAAAKEKERLGKNILERVAQFSPEQAVQVRLAMEHGLGDDAVEKMFDPDLSAEQMELMRTMMEKANQGNF